MAEITFNSSTFLMKEHESVLDCLLRNHQAIPYACRAGSCQACLIKTVDCNATEESTKWIKKTLQVQGYTLACKWIPDINENISARLPAIEEFSVQVKIKAIDKLNNRTIKLILDVLDKDSMFSYFPGQYLTIIHPDGIARSYSIANNYELDQHIELQISQTKHGIFTKWLFEQASIGDILHIRGPAGDCFYTKQDDLGANDYPIILAGIGTGLAPIYGILHEALKHHHKGPIHLYHGGRTESHLYYIKELLELEKQYSHFKYYPCVMELNDDQNSETFFEGNLEEVLDQKMDLANISHTHVYLCGSPDFVHNLRKKIFLKGAKSSNIFCDPFIERVINPS